MNTKILNYQHNNKTLEEISKEYDIPVIQIITSEMTILEFQQ